MGLAAEGQAEQARLSSRPASASEGQMEGSRVPQIVRFNGKGGQQSVPEMLQVLHLNKHVALDGSQLLQRLRP